MVYIKSRFATGWLLEKDIGLKKSEKNSKSGLTKAKTVLN